LTLIGRQHSLRAKDDWEAAKHEAVMSAIEELRVSLGPIIRMKDPAEKPEAHEE
jgi:hypothetical protein